MTASPALLAHLDEAGVLPAPPRKRQTRGTVPSVSQGWRPSHPAEECPH